MDDPWKHIPRLESGAPRSRGLSDRTVSTLLVACVVLLALMPFLIVATVWIMLTVTR